MLPFAETLEKRLRGLIRLLVKFVVIVQNGIFRDAKRVQVEKPRAEGTPISGAITRVDSVLVIQECLMFKKAKTDQVPNVRMSLPGIQNGCKGTQPALNIDLNRTIIPRAVGEQPVLKDTTDIGLVKAEAGDTFKRSLSNS